MTEDIVDPLRADEILHEASLPLYNPFVCHFRLILDVYDQVYLYRLII